MAYESKALLASVAQIMAKSKTMEEAYKAISQIANVEGVILKPFQELKKDLETDDSE
jgi:hypothetical protein